MRRAASAAVALALASLPTTASATAPSTFGQGTHSAGLAQSDVAEPEPTAAPQANAASAAEPGFRLRVGYGYGAIAMRFSGADAGVRDASGLELGAAFGAHVGRKLDVGFAIAAHVPDTHLARVAFRPATEPQFVLYDSALQRTTVDLVVALRYGAFSLGGGASVGIDVGGKGTRFTLGQDGRGTYADAASDVELPYRAAPIVGARLELGRAALGASFRGGMGVGVTLDAVNQVALSDNPLNGTSTVHVKGMSGYDPPTLDLGARLALARGLAAFAALEYAAYRAAPSPVADVVVEVKLGTTPSQREAHFIEPRFRDTLSPRFGLELRGGGERATPPADAWRWALRAGYLFAPSPVPRQTGFTTYADSARHEIALGGAYRFGRFAGVELAAGAAVELHVLVARHEDKGSEALPYAHFDVSGRMLYAAGALEATWR